MLFSMSCHPWESIDATERPEIRHPKASDHSLIFREVSLNDNDNQSMAFENKCSTGIVFFVNAKNASQTRVFYSADFHRSRKQQ